LISSANSNIGAFSLPDMAESRVAVVTGSSSGIGYETALTLARNGFTTFATMRDMEKREKLEKVALAEKLPIHSVQLDVTDDNSARNAIQKIVDQTERIDVLVNNAGYGLAGALEDLSIEEIKSQNETNFYGLIRVTQAVLPIMRKNGRGTIVNIGSVNGHIAFPCISAYASSKFALEGLTEAMAYELEPFGIRTVIIEPGNIKTNFKAHLTVAKKAQDPKSPYAKMFQKVNATIEQMQMNGSESALVADVVLKAVTSARPELRYPVGKDAEGWLETKKRIPDSEFRAQISQMIAE